MSSASYGIIVAVALLSSYQLGSSLSLGLKQNPPADQVFRPDGPRVVHLCGPDPNVINLIQLLRSTTSIYPRLLHFG